MLNLASSNIYSIQYILLFYILEINVGYIPHEPDTMIEEIVLIRKLGTNSQPLGK